MNIITTFILLICLIICSHVGNTKKTDKIVGGEICGYRELRYIVSIQSNSRHVCGGNIISPYHVITTASCIMHEYFVIYGNLAVFSGSHDLRGGNTGGYLKIIDVEIVIIHPEYDPKKFWINDISILKLTKSIGINYGSTPIALPKTIFSLKKLIVAGWGGSFPSYEPIDLLKKIEIISLNKKTCRSYYNNFGFVYGIQQCALTENPSMIYVTKGDSGGPVASRRILNGIVSLISMENDKPFVYTNVHLYATWIYESMIKY